MRKSQSMLNYGILLVVISIALFGMSKYLKRGIQGKVAGLSDAMLAPRAEHLAYTDDNFTSNTSSAQAANVTTILSGKGAQRKTSTVRVTSNSYTQTEDPDYVPGDSADPGVSSPSTEQSGSLGLE